MLSKGTPSSSIAHGRLFSPDWAATSFLSSQAWRRRPTSISIGSNSNAVLGLKYFKSFQFGIENYPGDVLTYCSIGPIGSGLKSSCVLRW